MGAVRIRWRALAKVTAIAIGALAALQLLPDLLKPPAPPPLAHDVGLPRFKPAPVQARRRRALPADVISSVPRPHLPPPRKPASPPPSPSAAPALVEAPSPAPIEPAPPAAELPPSPPAAPADGSEEFAPH